MKKTIFKGIFSIALAIVIMQFFPIPIIAGDIKNSPNSYKENVEKNKEIISYSQYKNDIISENIFITKMGYENWKNDTIINEILYAKEEFPNECDDHDCEMFIRQASCNIRGEKIYICKDCNEIICKKTYDPIGHTYKIEKERATCMNGGYEKYTCVRCGSWYMKNEQPEVEHKYVGIHTTPTCYSEGFIAYTCIYCADEYYVTEPITVHDLVVVKEIEPTCYTNGRIERQCTYCLKCFEEAIPMVQHTYQKDNYIVDIEATKTSEGKKSIHCDVCKAIISGTEKIIPKTN